MNSRCRMIALFSLLCMAVSVAAQQTQPPPVSPDASSNPPSHPEPQKEVARKQRAPRMLGLPQFTVTEGTSAPPLTRRGKFLLFYKTTFDPAEFVLVGLESGISQAENSYPGYGQGAAGYGKRYGAAFADQATSGFFGVFLYPTLLKEDPRYFRLGQGSTAHRFGYALTRVVICHKDNGGRTFNWSNVLGALSSGSISNAYYPQADRGFGLTMERAGISLVYGSLGGLGSEFWPDLQKKLFHRHPKAASPPASQPATQ